ncbi:MAG: cytochrome c-type biogenesis protein CcmH [Nitrospinae bacterium]|nr:cytochrome c-type biogenesis protein CcmH [Nitrospinota bacterium]
MTDAVYERAARDLMCLCGCNQTIKNCPHINCEFAVPARVKIRQMSLSGKSYDEIVVNFVQENGEKILAQPKKEGFNLVGYILPFIAISFVGFMVYRIVRVWSIKGEALSAPAKTTAAPQAQAGGELMERLKKELSEFED